jgi:hypothetical protein
MTENTKTPSRNLIVWGVGLAIVALLLVFLVGARIVTSLYGVLVLPEVPLPSGITQTRHVNDVYGYDTWAYWSEGTPTALIEQYASIDGASCRPAPFEQSELDLLRRQFPESGDPLSVCDGRREHATFAMEWKAVVSVHNPALPGARLDVLRRILWVVPSPVP